MSVLYLSLDLGFHFIGLFDKNSIRLPVCEFVIACFHMSVCVRPCPSASYCMSVFVSVSVRDCAYTLYVCLSVSPSSCECIRKSLCVSVSVC